MALVRQRRFSGTTVQTVYNPSAMRRLSRSGLLRIALGGAALVGIAGATQVLAQSAKQTTNPSASALLPSFDAASIKPVPSGTAGSSMQWPSPGRIHMVNASTRSLVQFAYGLKDFQLAGGPGWTTSKGYAIDAKTDDATASQLQKLPGAQQRERVQLMMQSLLADRFKLTLSRQTKDMPVYVLLVAKGGSKLTPTKYKSTDSGWFSSLFASGQPHLLIHPGEIDAFAQTVETLAGVLGNMPDLSDRLIEDHTGITGFYDFTLHFSPQVQRPGQPFQPNAPAEDSGPSIFTALEEQLGLRLDNAKGPVDVYTIDHIEEPTPN